MLEDPATAPEAEGVLVIDEHGDRKWGKKTAHVGKQWLGNIGKIDNGVVSVSSLWADEGVYYPLEVEPYTPAHHFEGGKADPEFPHQAQDSLRTGGAAVGWSVPFRAVVADILLRRGSRSFKGTLRSGDRLRAGLEAVARRGGIQGGDDRRFVGGRRGCRDGTTPTIPGEWVKVDAHLPRRAHEDVVGAGGRSAGPYGPEKSAGRWWWPPPIPQGCPS